MAAVAKKAKSLSFPLWLHTGQQQWAKKVRGRDVLFRQGQGRCFGRVGSGERRSGGRVPVRRHQKRGQRGDEKDERD